MLGFALIKAKIPSNVKIKRYAEIEFPSLVPVSSLKYRVGLPSLMTQDFGFLIRIFFHFKNSLQNLFFLKHTIKKNGSYNQMHFQYLLSLKNLQ